MSANPPIIVPTVITTAGLQPQDPQTLLATLVAYAQTLAPGLTTDLPGSLIEDIASTDVGALVVADACAVGLLNGLAPTTTNDFLTLQLGNVYGVPQGASANASVLLVFSSLPPGFVVNAGWTVTDGTRNYVVQDGGAAASSGQTAPLFAVCQVSGVFAVPANSVTTTVTSWPAGVSGSVTNPQPGTEASAAQTSAEYRAQVLQAGISTAQGVPGFIKTQLAPGRVPGAQPRLTSVQMSGGNLIVVSGGGDPYQTAGAIYLGVSNPAILAGCVLGIASISNANPAVITTTIAHGYTTGTVVTPSGITGGSGMVALNGNNYTATVTGPYTFTILVDTTAAGSYTGGGSLSPNLRNQLVSVQDAPDTYPIPYVNPQQQTTAIAVLWKTNSPNLVSNASIASLVVAPIVAYINAISAGQPINLLSLDAVFQQAAASVLTTDQITDLVWTVTINGTVVSPSSGTSIIPGDAFSYFETSAAQITVSEG